MNENFELECEIKKKKISFVIPCYCSTNSLRAVVQDISNMISGSLYSFEIILVNDGSPDGTIEIIKEIINDFDNVIGIELAKNFGQHSAYMAGYHYVSGDYIICLDDDGQNPPSEAIKLVDKLEKGYDAVYGSYDHKKQSFLRNFGSSVNEMMARFLVGKPKDLYISSFFGMKKFIVDEIVKYKNPYSYVLGLILRSTNKVTSVEVKHKFREFGQSGYNIRKLIAFWLDGFTSFSVKPLRMATFIGLFSSFFGFLYTLYLIVERIMRPEIVQGWTSLMATTLILGGIILFTLGLLGEYVGRSYISLNNSPQFVVRETITKNLSKENSE